MQIPALVHPHAITADGNTEVQRSFVQLELQPNNQKWVVVFGDEKVSDGIYEIDDNFKVLVEAVHGEKKIPEDLLKVFSYDSETKTLTPMDAEELKKIQSL